MKKVVIAGGSGFIGSALIEEFAGNGYEVVVLTRSGKPVKGARSVSWDPNAVGVWHEELNGAAAVINVCGESIMQRWTPASWKRIHDSRVKTTQVIGEAIARCKAAPKLWINTSASGFYGDTGFREISEASTSGDDQLAKLCQEWEDAVTKAHTPSTVRTRIRIGIVMGKHSEAFKQLSRITNFGLGGPVGDGSQYFSWIHVKDLARLFLWAAENPTEGVLNACSPEPLQNGALMASFRKHLGMPIGLPLPEFAAKGICQFMNWDPVILLGSTRAIPAIAEGRGFSFKFPTLEETLTDLIDDVPKSWKGTASAVA